MSARAGMRYKDDDPARAIANFAQEHQITQIVIGSSQRSRWQQLTGGGSNVTRIIKEAGALGIDVHVIALRKPSAAQPPGERTRPARNDRAGRGSCCSRGSPSVATFTALARLRRLPGPARAGPGPAGRG